MPWLGQVPAHWEARKLAHVCVEAGMKNQGMIEDNLLSLSYGRIIRKDIDTNEGLLPASFEGYQIVEEGDTVLRLTDLQNDQRSLRAGFVNERGIITSAYCAVRSTSILARWLFNTLRAADLLKVYYSMGGGVRQSLDFESIKRIEMPIPPMDEQIAIDAYLIAEEARIKSAISSQERMIELLKERRSTIITQAVTKGLDPKAKMKDSGVPWLGQVPAHWDVKALKYVSRYNQQSLGEDTNPDTEICYVEVSDVSQTAGIKSSEVMRFEDAPSRARRLMTCGEVIISTVRTYLKAIAFVGPEHNGKVCSTGFCVIRPISVEPKFAQYALAADFFMASVISRSTGVSYPAINASDLVRVKLAVPPLSEQKQISYHLSAELLKVDSAIASQERMIELLKERRSAIITQAVTGQIDVR